MTRNGLLAGASALVLHRQQRHDMRAEALRAVDRQLNGGRPMPTSMVGWAQFL